MGRNGLRTHHRQIPVNTHSRRRDLGLCAPLPSENTRYHPPPACRPGNHHVHQLLTPTQSQSTDIPIPPSHYISVIAQHRLCSTHNSMPVQFSIGAFLQMLLRSSNIMAGGQKSEMICSRVQPPLEILVLESLKLHLRLGTRPLSVI